MSRSIQITKAPRQSHINWNARCVFLITSKDGGVLFDLDNDEFLKLDPVAAEMWTLMSAGKSEAEVVRSIATECSVEETQLIADLRRLLKCAAERDIRPAWVQLRKEVRGETCTANHRSFPWYGQDPSVSRPKPRKTDVIRAFLALALFDLILSTRSLKSLCRLVNRWPVQQGNQDDPDLIGRICTAVESACVWYPKKALCLQRSAVTACLLRTFGFYGEMVVGARVMPLVSHAWVEVESCVVNDHPKVKSVYQPLVSF
jgi:hypothetical protein